jgi:hypothetical protein
MLSNTSALELSVAPPLAWDARLIRLSTTARSASTAGGTPIALILAIGIDLSSYQTEDQVWESSGCHVTRQVWRSNGYFVTPLDSVANALECVRNGDFDLVLLGSSVPIYDKKRLTDFVRSLGTAVRIVSVTDSPNDCADFADATVTNEPVKLSQCIGELLAALVGKL